MPEFADEAVNEVLAEVLAEAPDVAPGVMPDAVTPAAVDEYTWRAWRYMRRACDSPTHGAYPGVGAKGIRVCERWHSFANFQADMGVRPRPGKGAATTLLRLDESADFAPENCRWATRAERMRHRLALPKLVGADGVGRCLAEWAALAGLSYECLKTRLARGMPLEEALARPAGIRRRRRVSVNGATVDLSALAAEAGLTTATLAGRLRMGWTVEDAVGRKTRAYRKRISHQGETLTLKQWSALTGFSTCTLRYRLRCGWPLERVFGQPVRGKLKGGQS